jgi:hypothetical protein
VAFFHITEGHIMKFPRRQFLSLAASAVALLAVSQIARAQIYPTRPITIIVPTRPPIVPSLGIFEHTANKAKVGFFRRSPSPMIRFANKYDVSLDWLVCWDVARLGRHRVKDTAGKIAILPLGKPAA